MLAVLVAGGAFIFGLVAERQVPPQASMDVQNDVVRTVQRGDRATQIAIVPVEALSPTKPPQRWRPRSLEPRNDNVDAVLPVDSGGGVTPSDRIDHDLQKLGDAGIPVFCRYGGISASGGGTSPPAVNASWPSQPASPDPLA